MVCANCHRELHNPQSTPENLKKLIELHKQNVELKKAVTREKKYKFTLEEVERKRKECKSWQEVADFYEMSLSTLKRHRTELQNIQYIDGSVA